MDVQQSQTTPRPKFYPWQKGCPQGFPLGQFWSTWARLPGAISVFGLSPQQEKILDILYNAGFHRLTVSYPSYTNIPPRSYEHDEHKAPGTDIDFIIRNSRGELSPDPELMRAFLFLSGPQGKAAGFVGGVGIGVGYADMHLHVDARHPQTVRWIEIGAPGTEILETDPKWPGLFAGAKKVYRWESDDPQVSNTPGGFSGLSLALACTGGALGYTDKKGGIAKAALYAAGGFAAGWIVDKVLSKLDVRF
jgi:hypothetical protein